MMLTLWLQVKLGQTFFRQTIFWSKGEATCMLKYRAMLSKRSLSGINWSWTACMKLTFRIFVPEFGTMGLYWQKRCIFTKVKKHTINLYERNDKNTTAILGYRRPFETQHPCYKFSLLFVGHFDLVQTSIFWHHSFLYPVCLATFKRNGSLNWSGETILRADSHFTNFNKALYEICMLLWVPYNVVLAIQWYKDKKR